MGHTKGIASSNYPNDLGRSPQGAKQSAGFKGTVDLQPNNQQRKDQYKLPQRLIMTNTNMGSNMKSIDRPSTNRLN